MGELSSITLKDGCLGFSKFLFSLFVIFSHVWRCCISLYPPLKRLCWKTYFSLLGSCLGHNNVGDKEWGGNNEAATSTGLLILVFGTENLCNVWSVEELSWKVQRQCFDVWPIMDDMYVNQPFVSDYGTNYSTASLYWPQDLTWSKPYTCDTGSYYANIDVLIRIKTLQSDIGQHMGRYCIQMSR